MNNRYYTQWIIRAPLGLILIGMGACLIAEAAILQRARYERSKESTASSKLEV